MITSKYFIIILSVFIVPIAGFVLLPNSFNYNYLPPLFLSIGLYLTRNKNTNNFISIRSLGAKVFVVWIILSLVFTILFYDDKLNNLMNIMGITVIHLSVISFCRLSRKTTKFINDFCWFIFWFIIVNIGIQLIPLPLGEFLFERISGLTENTTNFRYTSLWESIKSFPSPIPMAFPTYRNHGVAFITTLGFSTCLALLNFPQKMKASGFKKTHVICFGFFCFICTYFTYSRTSFVALMLIILISAKFANKKASLMYLFLFIFIIPILIIIFLQQDLLPFLLDIFRIDLYQPEKTGAGREIIIEFHSQLFALKPIIGWGWILPYEEFGYDLNTNPFSESGFTFVLVTQGLVRGSLFMFLMFLAIARNLTLGKKSFYHALMSFFCIFLFTQFLFQGGLVSVTSSISAISHTLLAISLYSDSIANEYSKIGIGSNDEIAHINT
jgi:hypothetical protein